MSLPAFKIESTSIEPDETDKTVPPQDYKDNFELSESNLDSLSRTRDSESIDINGPELSTSDHSNEQQKQKEPPVAIIPKIRRRSRTFKSTNKWEGYVVILHKYYFTARITDLTGNHPDEEVDILFKDISADERDLIVEGGIFDWHIGHELENGTVKTSSIIRFRRMPRWTKRDQQKAEHFKSEIENLFE